MALTDSNKDTALHHRPIEVWGMARVFRRAASPLWNGLKRISQPSPLSVDIPNEELRQDIGFALKGAINGRGYL